MEFKQGKITPTTKREASVFTEFLQLQAVASGKQASERTKAQENIELSTEDSYRVFCAAERLLKTDRETTERQRRAAEAMLKGLAQARLDEVQAEIDSFMLIDENPPADVTINDVCLLAAQAVHPYSGRGNEGN